jgi:hypothetical protein
MHDPDTVAVIVEACVVLHNLLRMRYPGLQNNVLDNENEDHQIVPGAWRENANMMEVENRFSTTGKQLREYLKLYFNSEAGSVPWQDRMI